MTCIDLDEEIISVARDWFALEETDNLKCIAKDGLLFLQEQIERGKAYYMRTET